MNAVPVELSPTGEVNSTASYECFYFPAIKMVYMSADIGTRKETNYEPESNTIIYNVPGKYTPKKRCALSVLNSGEAVCQSYVNPSGNIVIRPKGSKLSPSNTAYISGCWFVG